MNKFSVINDLGLGALRKSTPEEHHKLLTACSIAIDGATEFFCERIEVCGVTGRVNALKDLLPDAISTQIFITGLAGSGRAPPGALIDLLFATKDNRHLVVEADFTYIFTNCALFDRRDNGCILEVVEMLSLPKTVQKTQPNANNDIFSCVIEEEQIVNNISVGLGIQHVNKDEVIPRPSIRWFASAMETRLQKIGDAPPLSLPAAKAYTQKCFQVLDEDISIDTLGMHTMSIFDAANALLEYALALKRHVEDLSVKSIMTEIGKSTGTTCPNCDGKKYVFVGEEYAEQRKMCEFCNGTGSVAL